MVVIIWALFDNVFAICFGEEIGFVGELLVFVLPKSRGGSSDDIGRSLGIMFSPKFQNPTMLVKHFHMCL